MCSLENFQRIKETNDLILSLLIDQLIKYGKKTDELLKDNSKNVLKSHEDIQPVKLTSSEQLNLNKIFSNIIQIALNEPESTKACLQYIKSFQHILISYPEFEKIDMSDELRVIYENLNKRTDTVLQDIKLGLSDIKTILYKN